MEEHVSCRVWWVVRCTGELWRAVNVCIRQFVARHDHEYAPVPNLTFRLWGRLHGTVINRASVSS